MQIESSYFWITIFCLAAGTLSIRCSILFLSSKIKISKRIEEILSFIPAAILPALTTPLVFFHEGTVDYLFGKERLVILILATIVCYFARSMVVTIGFGLGLLYLVTQV